MRSQILSLAWTYRKNNLFPTWGECQSAAWKTYRLKEAFRSGVVEVSFIKSDLKTVAVKTATLAPTFMPVYTSKGGGRKPKAGQILFFSTGDDAFRSLRIERLLDFKTVQKVA